MKGDSFGDVSLGERLVFGFELKADYSAAFVFKRLLQKRIIGGGGVGLLSEEREKTNDC